MQYKTCLALANVRVYWVHSIRLIRGVLRVFELGNHPPTPFTSTGKFCKQLTIDSKFWAHGNKCRMNVGEQKCFWEIIVSSYTVDAMPFHAYICTNLAQRWQRQFHCNHLSWFPNMLEMTNLSSSTSSVGNRTGIVTQSTHYDLLYRLPKSRFSPSWFNWHLKCRISRSAVCLIHSPRSWKLEFIYILSCGTRVNCMTRQSSDIFLLARIVFPSTYPS